MIFSWFLVISLAVSAGGNITSNYCKLLVEYEVFKSQLESYLASRDEICNVMKMKTDCSKIKEEFPEAKNGIYRIKPADEQESFLAYCDMESDVYGWLVIQRRQDGSEDFYRGWFEYMNGFGNLTGEFWLGNEKIHRLTAQGDYMLRVDMTGTKNVSKYAEFANFRVGNMSEFYKLTISGHSGTAADKLTNHNNMKFSARNLDLDGKADEHCAQTYHGGWWYNSCYHSNLNGLYTSSSSNGVNWDAYRQSLISMKIRPRQ